jgi:hypothetical protein
MIDNINNLDSKNDAVVSKYFDLVQNVIKELISKDKDIKSDEIERFNNEIFNQPVEIQDKIREYIDNATEKNLDIKKVAKTIYDKFKLQIKNNLYNQDDKQDVPNQLMGERKHIMYITKKNNKTMKHLKTFENYDEYLGIDTDDIPTIHGYDQYDNMTKNKISERLYDIICFDYIKNIKSIKKLLDKGADVNYTPHDNTDTMLNNAIGNGNVENVKILLKYGAKAKKDDLKLINYMINENPDDDNLLKIKELLDK